jgi:hypothetical protein
MVIQHILTEEIFSKVFDEDDFHRNNNVAKELYALEGLFFTGALKKNTLKALEPYYNAIRTTAHQITTHTCRWTILGSAAEVHRSTERSRIASALTGAADGLGIKEIMSIAEFGSRSAARAS